MRSSIRFLTPLLLLASLAGTAACARLSFNASAVVPTGQPLPYSGRVQVTDVGSYLLEPGATLVADPQLRNQVIDKGPLVLAGLEDWDRAVQHYAATRRTFAKGLTKEKSDVNLHVKIFFYLDSSLGFKFQHVYVAKTEATVLDPRNGRAVTVLTGFGKAAGNVIRGGREDDEEPVNRAVLASLNDLFGKIEADPELRL